MKNQSKQNYADKLNLFHFVHVQLRSVIIYAAFTSIWNTNSKYTLKWRRNRKKKDCSRIYRVKNKLKTWVRHIHTHLGFEHAIVVLCWNACSPLSKSAQVQCLQKKYLKKCLRFRKTQMVLVERSTEPIKTIKILTFYQERETSLYHVRRKQERGKLGFLSCAG